MSRTITTNGTIGIYLTDPLDNPVKVARKWDHKHRE